MLMLAGCRGEAREVAEARNRLLDATAPDYGNIIAQSGVIAIARRYRVFDDSISPAEAGAAANRLARAEGVWFVQAVPVADIWTRAELSSNPIGAPGRPQGIPYGEWHRALLPRAAAGLNREERRYLVSISQRRASELFSTFARAREVDLVGTRYSFRHAPRDRGPSDSPGPEIGNFGFAAAAWQAGAALALADGDQQGAERQLRELINAGVLLHDHGPSLLDAMVGIVIASRGLETLAGLYELAGYPEPAGQLRAELARGSYAQPGELLPRPLSDSSLFRSLPSIAARTDLPPGVKLDYLHLAWTVNYWSFCDGQERSALDTPEWRAEVVRGLGRTPHAAELLDWILWVPSDRSAC
jgi:hypothetical protein